VSEARTVLPLSADPFLKQRYDHLWSETRERIRAGNVDIDAVLAHKQADLRLGMTALFRPSEQVRKRVAELLDRLRELEPDQYYYDPAELHVTFLSLFTATEKHESFFARAEEYVEAVSAGIREMSSFRIFFTGITAASGAIMAQGFTDAAKLNTARDILRGELRSRDLDQGLDQRYRLETAHMTMVRFRQPLRDGKLFAEALERMRNFEFGQTDADCLELVRNDWYMSRGRTERLQTYRLAV
jgi:2'-5' RNA ligase